MTGSSKSVLILSHVFPPSGGAGVQRVLKFVKYLGDYGWRPVVVTPRSPSVPVRDHSYQDDLPPDLALYRLYTPEARAAGGGKGGGKGGDKGSARGGGGLRAGLRRLAGRLLFPDPHVVWLPFALPGTLAAARRHRVRALLASGPPFSIFLPAYLAARRLGLPLVLDFRDDWSGFFNKGFGAREAGWLWRNLVTRLEGRLVGGASLVIGNTPEMCRRLHRLHGGPEEKYVWIPNGFDPDDFRFPPPAPPDDGRLHILYVGTVFQSHPLDDLWQGIELLSPRERRALAVTIVGRAEADQVLDPGLEGLEVKVIPYRPHQEVVRLLGRAHLLLLTLAAIPGLERMVPAKLFEYLAARRPVLALVPRGAASKIVEACQAGAVVPPGRPRDLARLLRQWMQKPPPPLGPPPRFFDRRVLTATLARHLDRLSQGD